MRVLLLLAVASCGTPAEPAVPSGKLDAIPLARATPSHAPATKFTKKPLAVGDRYERTSSMTFGMSISVAMQSAQPYKSETSTNESSTYTAEVLEMKAGVPSKLQVLFDKAESSQSYGGNVVPRPNTIAGKTFVIEPDRYGSVDVKGKDGKQPDYTDLYEVRRRFEGGNKGDALYEALPSKPIERGQPIDASATLLAQYFSETQQHGLTVTDSRIIFRDEADGEGIFDITMTVLQNQGAMLWTMEVRGEARVAIATSQTTSLTLEGPLKIDTQEQYKAQMSYEGTGTFAYAMQRRAL